MHALNNYRFLPGCQGALSRNVGWKVTPKLKTQYTYMNLSLNLSSEAIASTPSLADSWFISFKTPNFPWFQLFAW